MARLKLKPVDGRRAVNEAKAHRASTTEGEAALRLLEANGYVLKRKANGQYELMSCPFHEAPGKPSKPKATNFYVDAETSKFACHSASCGEQGNLVVLERHFGVDPEDSNAPTFNREQRLKEWEQALTPERRGPFYERGLTDTTIERFRLGWIEKAEFFNAEGKPYTLEKVYVIPYLEGRRPVAFRFYSPEKRGPNGSKYWWESGTDARLFNPGHALGDRDGITFVCEGEIKTMLLVQLGYAATGIPGAGNFKKEWHSQFAHAKQIIIVFDNDNPVFHVHENCNRCGAGRCIGHNPGQEGAIKVVEAFGWRARNVVLPLPDGATRKTDINEYFQRDGWSNADFAELALGMRKTPFKMMSLRELFDSPPDESTFIVSNGILPKGGRLVVSGAPKCGKSLLIENMALSIASGIPFLKRFPVDEPRRVGILDRELSRRSLFQRLDAMVKDRPGYKAAMDNLCIDHDIQIKLDRPNESYEALHQLVKENGLDVLFFDTAYKFFASSFTNEDSVSKAFATLDRLIAETGVSIVLTHHHRKRPADRSGTRKEGIGDPDDVVGSFLWTGWPNATILLNFMKRRVESPFNTVCSFVSFRDDAPPPPVALYRDADSVAYSAIQDYNPGDEHEYVITEHIKPSADAIGDILLNAVPVVEADFLERLTQIFGCNLQTVRPHYVDLMSRGQFLRTDGHPSILKFVGDEDGHDEETYEQERAQLRLVTDEELDQ